MERQDKHKIVGLVLMVVGLTWVLSNFELIPKQISSYLYHWENILIGVGLFLLMATDEKRKGIFLLVLGLILGADYLFDLDFSVLDLWPLLLVIAGATLIRRAQPATNFKASETHDGINDFALFGGGDRVFDSQNFRYGQLTAILGGSNIDLTTAEIHSEGAKIDVLYIFGGSKIRVPNDWQVSIKATALFGGLSDKRFSQSLQEEPSNKKLVIKGLILFGGAEIVN